MKKNQLIWFIIAIVVLLGIAVYQLNNPVNNEPAKNIDVLMSRKNLPIMTAEIPYYEDAIGYLARPLDGAVYPGVVMMHENRGLRPETKMAANQLAKDGYMVLAVDLLGGTAEDQEGARALTANFNQEKGVANMRAAVEFLRAQGAKKIASLGWCFGGRQSLALATSGEKLDSTVVYYGGGMPTTREALAPIKWPVLGIFGDQDQSIPVAMVREFESSLDSLKIDKEIYIYEGVGHAFANPSGTNYVKEQTIDAWEKTLSFLERTLK